MEKYVNQNGRNLFQFELASRVLPHAHIWHRNMARCLNKTVLYQRVDQTRTAVYLSSGNHISYRMNTQTKDVIRVCIVKSLLMMFTIVHNPQSSHMVHYLPTLSVEQIVPAIISSVAEEKRNQQTDK